MHYSYIDQGISEPFMSCKHKVYVNIIRSNIIQFKKQTNQASELFCP